MPNKQNCKQLEVLKLVFSDKEQNFCHLYLQAPGWNYKPGQFVMLRPDNFGQELTWGRPLSICALNEDHLHLFFQVLGRGTQKLAELKPGDKITVWGPLGRGFMFKQDQPLLILAGGMGLAPFVEMAVTHSRPELIHLLFGHQPDISIYPFEAFKSLGHSQNLRQQNQEDLQEFITLLEKRIAQAKDEQRLILACGPLPFLKTVQKFALQYDVPAQLSLENKMGCGVGACLGCVAEHKQNGLVQTCVHGPVFDAAEIKLD